MGNHVTQTIPATRHKCRLARVWIDRDTSGERLQIWLLPARSGTGNCGNYSRGSVSWRENNKPQWRGIKTAVVWLGVSRCQVTVAEWSGGNHTADVDCHSRVTLNRNAEFHEQLEKHKVRSVYSVSDSWLLWVLCI